MFYRLGRFMNTDTEVSPERFPATWTVKKGDTFLVQIEITEDTDLLRGSCALLESVYQDKDLGGFKVNTVHFVKSKEELVKQILERLGEAAAQL